MIRSSTRVPITGRDQVDVIVVGGGPAGLSAAKILARSRRSVLVVDAGAPRNLPADGVHNYLYAEGTSPAELVELGRKEARLYGVEVIEDTASAAERVEGDNPRFTVDVGERRVTARRLVLATGVVDILPDIAGMRERWGTTVFHCPFCHGWEVRDQAIGVVGTGPMSVHQLMVIRQLSDDVIYFQHTAPELDAAQTEQLAALGIEHISGEVVALETIDDGSTAVRMKDGRIVSRETIAVASRPEAREVLLSDLGLSTTVLLYNDVDFGRHLAADASGLTDTPGVWAAGNLTAPMAQVVNAAADGAGVGAAIHMDLIMEDTALAVAEYRSR